MNTLSGNVHLVAGGAERVDDLVALLEHERIRIKGNPDAYVRRYASFGIDDAHDLSARAASRAFGVRRIFIISADTMTREAQNALLKTLEEPSADALFFFIVPSPETLLPTLRSRAQTLALQKQHVGHRMSHIEVGEFLEANAAKRLEMLKPLLEKGEDDKRDLGAVFAFLAALEKLLSDGSRKKEDMREAAEAVYRARNYIGDRGALVKLLLEQVALLVPQM